ncbi:PilN domain-containing protein [Candidatus Falkowbacteria bacterium]|jgi:Tfp pilus assembly protein PilN|nr:PilN domain-containing protein [Candidatus Falkowbacteria bacterium]MBT5503308.1 PilN domain-containing protein [Candidatus Falkowbacteria bacterium]MBT6573640.1 PilN domain-containing protein [Candidatus Falkowbacteria bacterium]MBT7349158.1 PilN domain-containing protein [Candidatus Falkowbacteria bacterium]MBT7500111.1 PilN domain-containing protein [Candidatus Falkowbacteria bacterium]
MSISLLPEDLRDKEDQEKEKVKQAMGDPKFKMHLPEEKTNALGDKQPVKKQEVGIEIGLENAKPEQKKGIFRMVKKKSPQPLKPPAPPKIEKPVAPLAPPPAPVKRDESTFLMHIPKILNRLNGKGKKIIRETADQLEEVVSPPPLADQFGKKNWQEQGPQPEVNLMEEDYVLLVRRQFWLRVRNLLVVVFIFSMIFVGGYIFIKIQKTNLLKQYAELGQTINQTEAEINSHSLEKIQAISLKDRAQVLQILLNNHIYWTQFLDKLEHHTVKDVYYTNFVAQSNGNIVLSAKAKTYNNVAEQLLTFKESDFVDSVEINSASQAPEEVVEDLTFLDLELSDEIEAVEAVEVAPVSPIDFSITLKLKQDALLK